MSDSNATPALPANDAAATPAVAAVAPALPAVVHAAHARTIDWQRRVLSAATAGSRSSGGGGESAAAASSSAETSAAASDSSVAAASSSAAIAAPVDGGAGAAPASLLPLSSDSDASISALTARAARIASMAPVASAAQRISQLDALALDAELGWMLHSSLRRLTKFLPSSSWLAPGGGGGGGGGGGDHKAEFELVLSSVIFLATIARDRATPGMKLQNVVFQNWAAVAAARSQAPAAAGTATEGWVAAMTRRLCESVGATWLSGGHSGPKAAGAALSDSALGALSGIPRSNFAPFDPTAAAAAAAASSSVSSLLDDAAASVPSSAAAASGSVAVLSAALPSTAAVPLSLRQKSLYFLCSVVLRYAWSKLHAHMTLEGWGGFPAHSWQLRCYRWARRAEAAFQAASIGNFVLFLSQGQYRSVLERALQVRLVYLHPRLARALSFEFMNQQIAWAALSEFMLFLLPLVPFAGIMRAATKARDWIAGVSGSGSSSGGAGGRSGAQAAAGGSAAESVSASLAAGCPCCGLSPPFQPYVASPCNHIFCYYCLAGHRLAEQQQARGLVASASAGASSDFQCPRCEQSVLSQAPLVLAAAPSQHRSSVHASALF